MCERMRYVKPLYSLLHKGRVLIVLHCEDYIPFVKSTEEFVVTK